MSDGVDSDWILGSRNSIITAFHEDIIASERPCLPDTFAFFVSLIHWFIRVPILVVVLDLSVKLHLNHVLNIIVIDNAQTNTFVIFSCNESIHI
ncbi:hypothetical protein C485_05663 [Natrinema altunense JCM 12890]|uniref:Uncharacterized protein n=1 Tax=Natrinema altunense (strain JCM 12890 / CGMCC 1.3731 / AJ2) TaxID=1227494 RepID=L9ZQK5_NATA2|nr:hypothetical protein C485_05663 [Natrinema altunense JCM 12890]